MISSVTGGGEGEQQRYTISSACAVVQMCGLQNSAVPNEIVLRGGVTRPEGLLSC